MFRLSVTRDRLPANDSLQLVTSTPIIFQIRNPFDVIVSSQLVLASVDADVSKIIHHVSFFISSII